MSMQQSNKIDARDAMETEAVSVPAPSKCLIFESFKQAIVIFLAVLAVALSICAFTGEQAEAKTYTGTWEPPAVTNGGWVNLSTSISVTIDYVDGADTMTVSFRENYTTFGKSWLYGDAFKDGFCLITPPRTPTHEIMGCNRYSGPSDTHSKARQDFQTWANANGSSLIFYASQSNANDSNHSKGGALSSGGTYTYDLRGYKTGDVPVLLWYGNRYQTPYNGYPGQSFVYHYATLTTKDFGFTIKIPPKVTSSSGTGGKITPAGTITYPYGGNSSTYTWSRDYGYALKDVIIDGQRKGATLNSYQFRGMTSDHSISVEWLELGTLALTKQTADSSLSVTDRYSLAGAQYILYTDAACTNKAKDVEGRNVVLTTDSSGKASTQKVIYPGTYYLKETIASKGFRLDPQAHAVTVVGGRTASVVSNEEPKRGYITVQKESSAPELTSANGCYTLKGATYDVIRDGKTVATLTTDGTGKTNTFTAPLGNYTVKEATPSEGFRTDKRSYSVDIASDNQSKTFESVEVPLIDTYPLALHKMDREVEDTGHADTPQAGLSLAGAQYKVNYYDGYYTSVLETAPIRSKWEKTFTTALDSSSKAFFEVLSDDMYDDGTGQMGWLLGTYVVEEIKAPYGYFLDDRDPYVMQVTKNTAESAESHVVPSPGSSRTDAGSSDTHITSGNAMLSSDEPQRANLMIMIFGEKTTDGDDTPSQKVGLENVSFNIINENENDVYSFERGMWVKPGEVVATITSDDQGYCNTEDLARTGGKDFYLPMGEYRVHPVEDTVPEGYKQPEDYLLDVTVPYRTYRWVIEDKIGTVLRIEKIDEDTGKRVSGFSAFEIYNKDTGERVIQQADYPSGAMMSRFTTDVTGKVTLPDKLMNGNYFIREVQAPYGYSLAEDVENDIPFTITGDTVNTYDDPVVIQFGDHATKARLRVSTIDNASGAYIVGSSSHVKVFAKEDIVTADGTVRFLKGQLVFEGDTDPNKGFVDAKDLYPGKYEVVQGSAPAGYVVNKNTYSVSLDYVNGTAPIRGEAKIPNKAQKSDVEANLVQSDSGQAVREPGGIFDIVAAKDVVTPDGTVHHEKGDVVGQVFTDDTGRGVTDEPLYPGEYVAIQTDAPDGYVPDEEPVPLVVESRDGGFEEGMAVSFVKPNTPQQGIIRVEKKDNTSAQNVLVAGGEFAIYANEDIKTADGTLKHAKGDEVGHMVTRADGTATSEYLYVGSYKVREVKAPAGYMNNTSFEAVVDIAYEDGKPYSESGSAGTCFMDQAALGTAEIAKIDSNTKLPLKESGIVIDVVAAEDIVTPDGVARYHKGDVVASGMTDELGKAKFENLHVGKYAAIQKGVAPGYDINEEPVPFEIEYNNDSEPPKKVFAQIEDDALTGEIEIRKVISGSSPEQAIASSPATFRVTAAEDIATVDGTLRLHAGDVVAEVSTGSDGVAKVSGLYSGRYNVVETKAPAGYVMDGQSYVVDARYELEIGEDGNREYVLSKTLTVGNSLQKSSIVIENRDAETRELIKGSPASFEIKAKEDIFDPEGGKIFSKGDVVAQVETGEDGTVMVPSLPIGKYEIAMTDPADGYPLDDEPHDVETKYDSNAGVDGTPVVETYETAMPTCRIEIDKVNAYDGQTKVKGAEFTLTASADIVRGDGSIVMEEGNVAAVQTTSTDGKAAFVGIKQGRYVLSESKAPDGYLACPDREVVVAYKHGETEVLIEGDDEQEEQSVQVGQSADMGSLDEIGANGTPGSEAKDLFCLKMEIQDEPVKAIVSKTGPMGGHISGCELAIYRLDAEEGSESDEVDMDALDEKDLVDRWTTIDKQQGKDEYPVESAAGGEGTDDVAGGGELDEAAVQPVSEGAGIEGKVVEKKDDDSDEPEILSSFDGTDHVVYPLVPGKYVLVETEAAEGYGIAEPIVFEVEESDADVRVSMVDNYAGVASELVDDVPAPEPELAVTAAKEIISEYGDMAWILVVAMSLAGGGIAASVTRRRTCRR